MNDKPTPEDLRASGCSAEQIKQFSECRCAEEKLKLLRRQRKKLLDSIHEQEEQISNLDYLAHEISKDGQQRNQ